MPLAEKVLEYIEDDKVYNYYFDGNKQIGQGYDIKQIHSSNWKYCIVLIEKIFPEEEVNTHLLSMHPLRDGMGRLLPKNIKKRLIFREALRWAFSTPNYK